MEILRYTLIFALIALSEEAAITVSPSIVVPRSNRTMSNTKDKTKGSMDHRVIIPCLEEHRSYCIHGFCSFHKDLSLRICRCFSGYTGERCEHLTLNTYSTDSPVNYIAVGVGVGILLSGIIAFIYCTVQMRCVKPKSPYKICFGERTLDR
ncbi:epigen [Microcaecilia unicolor]|uniref:Epigen n=1 Tax=Microcaecilia unicolor TaxID=1415580 RepID=A0A6P7XCM4_9AMPH|nr:epigen [Microcaecilia unicolor]